MNRNKFLRGLFSLSAVALLAACSTDNSSEESSEASSENTSVESSSDNSSMDHTEHMDGMMHDDSGEIPSGLKEAENPAYSVGDTVTLKSGHMEGMEGATAEIIGAFDTTAYEISYDPVNGGNRVEHHKWVVQEEIADAEEQMIESGTEVTLEANHMEGMKGATATIESSENTTVYMIDYQPTTGGEIVKNHKWVTESEVTTQ